MTPMSRACTPWLIAMLALLGSSCARADPPGPVTACGSDTQAGAGLNLAQALSFGGVIRFRCPPGSVIVVSGRYALNASTLIDGADAITLDGRGAFGPMLQTANPIILRRITVRGFAQRPPPQGPGLSIGRVAGSVLAAGGDAELDHVNIEGSQFPVSVRGTAFVQHSSFVGNRGGLTVNVDGIAHVEHTRFTGNARALAMRAGWVRHCDFSNQTLGALTVNAPTAAVEIRHSTFSGTRGGPALAISQRAEAGGPQTVSVRANVFRDNEGAAGAGAIALVDPVQDARERQAPARVISRLAALPPAAFVLAYNRFIGNRGGRGAAIAADLANTGGMSSIGDLFVGNSAGGDGGAVAVTGGAMRIGHALFKGNRAGGRGAAVAVAPNASASLVNALVIGNVGPGGAIEGNSVNVVNVTIADNLSAGLLLETVASRAANVLLARNRPADCLRVPAGVFRGAALQSDGSCPGAPVGEAFLDTFYVPAAGSPALRAGDPALCRGTQVRAVDLPFQGRLDPGACALGAFERPPLRKLSQRIDRRETPADLQDDFADDEGYRPPPSTTDSGSTTDPTADPATMPPRTGGSP